MLSVQITLVIASGLLVCVSACLVMAARRSWKRADAVVKKLEGK